MRALVLIVTVAAVLAATPRAAVAANSRDGLPSRGVLDALRGAAIYRTDRLGTIELVLVDGRIQPASG